MKSIYKIIRNDGTLHGIYVTKEEAYEEYDKLPAFVYEEPKEYYCELRVHHKSYHGNVNLIVDVCGSKYVFDIDTCADGYLAFTEDCDSLESAKEEIVDAIYNEEILTDEELLNDMKAFGIPDDEKTKIRDEIEYIFSWCAWLDDIESNC